MRAEERQRIPGSGAPRVLVIESDRDTAAMLRTLLEPRGFHVRLAYDGLSGLAALQAEPFSVIILALGIAGLNGQEVAARVNADPLLRDTPMIVLADGGDFEQRVRLFELGVDDYLPKPVKPLELLSCIQALLKRGSAPPADRMAGQVIVFAGCAGGVGTTTICANVAQALAVRGPTVVVDAGWPLGALSLQLDAPRQDGVEQVLGLGLLGQSLEPYLAGGRSGVRFRYLDGLSALDPEGRPHLDMEPLLSSLKTLARYVLVDAGTFDGPFAASVLRAADTVAVVMALERTHLSLIHGYLEYLDRLGVRRSRRLLLANRLRPSPLGIREVQRELEENMPLVVPYEGERLSLCLNEGSLLLTQYPNSAGAVALAELASTLSRQVAVET